MFEWIFEFTGCCYGEKGNRGKYTFFISRVRAIKNITRFIEEWTNFSIKVRKHTKKFSTHELYDIPLFSMCWDNGLYKIFNRFDVTMWRKWKLIENTLTGK